MRYVNGLLLKAMTGVQSLAHRLHRDERGQDLIEYALLGGLIALTLMAAAVLLALTGALQAMGAGIGRCIDFDSAAGSVCAPF